MSNPKNHSDELPDNPDCILNPSEVKPIEEILEINDDVPATPTKPKRPYRWKGEKKRERTPEHNQKISKAMSGRQLSEDHKAAISEAMMGNQNFQ